MVLEEGGGRGKKERVRFLGFGNPELILFHQLSCFMSGIQKMQLIVPYLFEFLIFIDFENISGIKKWI